MNSGPNVRLAMGAFYLDGKISHFIKLRFISILVNNGRSGIGIGFGGVDGGC